MLQLDSLLLFRIIEARHVDYLKPSHCCNVSSAGKLPGLMTQNTMCLLVRQVAFCLLFAIPVCTQYVPVCSKNVTKINSTSVSSAGCSSTIGSNQTLTVYSTADCSDKGWQLGPLNYDTSTPSRYAFQAIKMSRQAKNNESILFSSLGPTVGTYWRQSSNPLQALYGSFPSYCGTSEVNLTWQGISPLSPTNNSACKPLVENATLVRLTSSGSYRSGTSR